MNFLSTIVQAPFKRQRVQEPKEPEEPSANLTVAETFKKKEQEAHIFLDALCHAILFESIPNIKKCLLEVINQHISVNKMVQRKSLDGTMRWTNPILTWVQDRYEKSAYDQKKIRKTKLQRKWNNPSALEKDACDILKMLLDCGADPYVCFPDTKQDPLHVAIADGFPQCVMALVRHVEYDIQRLAKQDSHGDSVVHSALANGHFDCAEIMLFSKQKKLELSLDDLLDQLEDDKGDNLLAALVRYTDIRYDDVQVSKADQISSQSYDLLKKIVDYLKQNDNTRPLLKQNKRYENVAAVAARCGTYHELKLVLSLNYMSNFFKENGNISIPIANTCTGGLALGSANVKSPLDLAKETHFLIVSNLNGEGGTLVHFENSGICGCEEYVNCKSAMKSWKISIERCIELLRNLSSSIPCDLQLIQKYRQLESERRFSSNRRNVKILTTQSLTRRACNLRRKLIESSESSKQVDLPHMLNLSAVKTRYIENAIISILESGNHCLKKLIPKLIRDPQDPCHRASLSLTAHFGLFAAEDIPADTIIIEYAGEVRYDDEGHGMYEVIPEYAVKLETCEAFILSRSSDEYVPTVLLDAEFDFNEGSLINDHRWSLDGDEDVLHRKVNVKFVEAVVEGWPHIFVMSTCKIKRDEELLIDYGSEYWDKVENERYKKKEMGIK
ncbi:hypothetical protein CTEN210_18492 [Chaetoceros tenuissimus]|uniref:SET domain-containing protein n=1 Tax=Chaetoceros tenuissimus TaxID=426638 RepID=A0AAD3DEV1_9STRA|nr:hypothetical protein CTEN210_18492 [Chaetoceros tenuissimus]